MRNLTFKFDLFFISNAFFDKHRDKLLNTIVVPKEDFKKNSSLSNVIHNSQHQTWALSYDYVIFAEPGWYESLNDELRNAIKVEMIQSGYEMIHDNHLVTSNYWRRLSNEVQQAFIHQFDDDLSDTKVDAFQQFPHLVKLHNKFPNEHGSNCLSATIYAITKQRYILNHWMHQATFLFYLDRLDYQQVEDSFQSGDVICFYHKDSLTHASYALDDTYIFNKQGQTYWEPWTIERFSTIYGNRDEKEVRVFRRFS